jgi:hypothetical protein
MLTLKNNRFDIIKLPIIETNSHTETTIVGYQSIGDKIEKRSSLGLMIGCLSAAFFTSLCLFNFGISHPIKEKKSNNSRRWCL